MKPLMQICPFYVKRLAKPLGLLLALTFAAQAVLVTFQSFRMENAYLPYDGILSFCRVGMIYTLAAVLGLAIIVALLRLDHGGRSRAVYTLMTLPLPRRTLPLAWALTALTFLLTLTALQLLLIGLLYPVYTVCMNHAVQELLQFYELNAHIFSPATLPEAGYTHGLYRTFLQLPLLRCLTPYTPLSLLLLPVRLALPAALVAWLGARRRLTDVSILLILCTSGLLFLLYFWQINCCLRVIEWILFALVLLALAAKLLHSTCRAVEQAKNLA